jgi:hypothetical protein
MMSLRFSLFLLTFLLFFWTISWSIASFYFISFCGDQSVSILFQNKNLGSNMLNDKFIIYNECRYLLHSISEMFINTSGLNQFYGLLFDFTFLSEKIFIIISTTSGFENVMDTISTLTSLERDHLYLQSLKQVLTDFKNYCDGDNSQSQIKLFEDIIKILGFEENVFKRQQLFEEKWVLLAAYCIKHRIRDGAFSHESDFLPIVNDWLPTISTYDMFFLA